MKKHVLLILFWACYFPASYAQIKTYMGYGKVIPSPHQSTNIEDLQFLSGNVMTMGVGFKSKSRTDLVLQFSKGDLLYKNNDPRLGSLKDIFVNTINYHDIALILEASLVQRPWLELKGGLGVSYLRTHIYSDISMGPDDVLIIANEIPNEGLFPLINATFSFKHKKVGVGLFVQSQWETATTGFLHTIMPVITLSM
ncbi:MAG: hypothetical protein J0L94_02495 [Rhodothermia bacterium]|nr:hypothetical protein [Rhodothermia bacterium]